MTVDIQNILNPLRRAGWVLKQKDEKDFSVLFAVLIDALDIQKDFQNICSAIPFVDDDNERHIGLIDLLNTMTCFGKVAHPLKIDLKSLDPRLYPCLFVPNNNRDDDVSEPFIILNKIENEKDIYSVFYQNGHKTEDFILDKPLKGTAWIFTDQNESNDTLSKAYRDASGYQWFNALLARFKSGFIPILAMGGMLTILSLAAPLFVMLVYDRVITSYAPETLGPLIMGAVLALIVEAGLRIMRAQSLSWYGARLDYIVSTHIFERLVKLPVLFTERASVAAQIARVKAFDAVRAFFTGPQMIALAEIPFVILLLIAVAVVGGKLVFVPLAALAIYITIFLVMRHPIRTAMRFAAQCSSSRQEMVVETFEKMDGLRAGGLTSIWLEEFRTRSGKASMASFYTSWLSSILESMTHVLYMVTGLSVVVGGVLQIWSGHMTPGALVAVMIITWRILSPMQTLCNALPRFIQLQNAIAQINRLMKIETEEDGDTITARLDNPKGGVRFNKVGLRYTKESDPVFTGLDFTIEPGQLVAVTGSNGAGKSTILKLINGLYRPQAGSIHIDGIDIRQIEPRHLRSHIAYMPQTPNIYHGTIMDNLRFANPLADDEMLKNALEAVDLWSYVEKLPMGMLSIIGAQGSEKLPTGLAYNIALARAYVQDSPIMVFDELPYAFLNGPAGEMFKKKLQEWKGKKTILLVTHREDYMTMADQVVLLQTNQRPIVDHPDKTIEMIYQKNKEAA